MKTKQFPTLYAIYVYSHFEGICTEDKKKDVINYWNEQEFDYLEGYTAEEEVEFEEVIINDYKQKL